MLPAVDRSRVRVVGSSRRSAGPIVQWIRGINGAQRAALLKRLVRMDVALAASLPCYAASPRAERVCFMLMNECAARRGLNAGELAMLCVDAERDALEAMAMLATGGGDGAGPRSPRRPGA